LLLLHVDMQMAGEMFDLFNLRVYRRSITFARVFLRREIMRSHEILLFEISIIPNVESYSII